MILSVSRRTDIPNYYSEWFYNRIKAGFVCVRNPMNVHQISRIKYTPEYHLKAFGQIAEALRGYTNQCVISFVDIYAKNKKVMEEDKVNERRVKFLKV